MQALLSIGGRALLVAIFLMSAAFKLMDFKGVAGAMAAEGVPEPRYLLPGAIAFLIGGGLMVLVGYQARFGALLLAIFLGMATYYFHDFWTFDAAKVEAKHAWVASLSEEDRANYLKEVQQNEMGSFFKNLALLGAMLVIVANGSGAGSLEGDGAGGSTEAVRERRPTKGDF